MKLKDGNQELRTNILMMQPLPTNSQAYRLVLQEERHKWVNDYDISANTESFAFVVDKRRFNDRYGD